MLTVHNFMKLDWTLLHNGIVLRTFFDFLNSTSDVQHNDVVLITYILNFLGPYIITMGESTEE